MLILLGGAPRVGKSQLAASISKQHGISSISTDLFVEAFDAVSPQLGLGYGMPRDQREEIFLPAFVRAIRQVEGVYGTYMFEGELISPLIVDRLANDFNISVCFLGMSEPSFESMLNFENGNPWLGRLDDSEQVQFVEEVKMRSETLRTECVKRGYSYIDLSVGDYLERIAEVRSHLIGGI